MALKKVMVEEDQLRKRDWKNQTNLTFKRLSRGVGVFFRV